MERLEIISNDKIYLTPLTLEDALLVEKWHKNSVIIKNTGNFHDVFGFEDARSWFFNGKHKYLYIIVEKQKNEPIGYCDLYNINKINRTATFGIAIGNYKNRNKGYGSSSVKLLLKYAFNQMDLNNISLTVREFNIPAIKCYTNLGFYETERQHKSILYKGKFYDNIHMEILKENFEG